MRIKNTLNFDLKQLAYSENGVDDYYWPVRVSELNGARARLRSELYDLIKEVRVVAAETAALVESIVLAYVNCTLQMLQATLIKTRCERDNVEITPAPNYRFLSMLLGKAVYSEDAFVTSLKKGPPPLSKLKSPLRFSRDLVIGRREGIQRRVIAPINYEKDIITFVSHGLVQQWKKQAKARVIFQRPNAFFSSIKNVSTVLSSSDTYWVGRLLNLFENQFSVFNVNCSAIFRQYMENFLKQSFVYSKAHIVALRKRKKIPNNFWGNTGGSIWTRLLSIVVRERGGEVTCFDHAGGYAYFDDLSDLALKEFLMCNYFVTYSDAQAKKLVAYVNEDALLYPKNLSFHVVKDEVAVSFKSDWPQKIKKIMYVSSIFSGERVGISSDFMASVTMMDWQLRLVSQLKKMGYEVEIQPHPESIEGIANELQSACSVPVSNKVFEVVFHDVDMILYDFISTSTLRYALLSNKPVVFMDFGLRDVAADAKETFNNRVAVVEGFFDQENRATIDWNELSLAIEKSISLKDKSFCRRYFQ